MDDRSGRSVIISADGHCGADLYDYKPYLERRFHDEFDRWASTYHDAWGDVDEDAPSGERIGAASFDAPLNWDSVGRLRHAESQGIAAEVLFPNTSPPFFPSGAISAPGPRDQHEHEHRFAGLRAHNRWLAEFCRDTPGQRAGLAQVFLDDVDAAIAEVRWAAEAGLMGVLLPNDHVLKMANLYYPAYDRFWAVCADLDLPVHRHGVKPTESAAEAGPASVWVGSFETLFYQLRALSHVICAGVFERYPSLKLVTTEVGSSADILPYLSQLDSMYLASVSGGQAAVSDISDATSKLTRLPSEYFATNCFVGGAFDIRSAHDQGVPNLMWGADIPHAEGTSPFSRLALRHLFAGLPADDVRRLTSLTAARVYGFDLDQLQATADRIGPTVEEMATPLRPEERPKVPEETRSLTFVSLAQFER